jgi:branched-chain amino acid transport system permease protein
MVTFVLPLIIISIIEMSGVLGGVEGLSALSPIPNLWVTAYFIIFALLAFFFGFRRLMDTDYGLVLKAIRDNDQAVMSGGINIYWYKAQALLKEGLKIEARLFSELFRTMDCKEGINAFIEKRKPKFVGR